MTWAMQRSGDGRKGKNPNQSLLQTIIWRYLLNQLCGAKHDLLSSAKIPKKIMHIEMQVPKMEKIEDKTMYVGTIGAIRDKS
jgi:hypothetical protein